MRLVCALLVLLFGSTGWAAGESVAEIPIELHDGFIWVQARAPGLDRPLHLLLDSGAQVSVLEQQTARKLGLNGGRALSVAGVGSSLTGYWPQPMEAWAGDTKLPHHWLRLDLRHLANACTNRALEGLLGADFLRDRIVQLDFRNHVLRVLREAPAVGSNQALPLKCTSRGMLVPVSINGSAEQWLRLDTGCASPLQWVAPPRSQAHPVRNRIAVALNSFSVPVMATTVSLGHCVFANVATDLQPKPLFPGEKGLLGNGLLSRFESITIDAKAGKLFLQALGEHTRSG